MAAFRLFVFSIAFGLLTAVAAVVPDAESAFDDSADISVLMLTLMRGRPVEWPLFGMSAFISDFRHQFGIPPAATLNASVVFDTCIFSFSNTTSSTSATCDRINIASNTTNGDTLFLLNNNISGCAYGYVPVQVPDYMRNNSSESAFMLIGYRILGALAVLLLLGQIAFWFYRFNGVSFVKKEEFYEVD